jgi:methionine-rich copper-binding protein CopC
MRHRFIATLIGSVIAAAIATVAAPGVAAAQPAAGAVAAGAAAEVKAARGVEKKEPLDPGDTFAAGTKVWIWSRVTGAAGTTVKHVWKKDDKQIWQASLKIGGPRWTTSSRRQLKAGSYTVDVVGADGSTLGSVSFTVQ